MEINLSAVIETLDIKITRSAISKLAETDFDHLPFGRTFTDHMFTADYKDGKWQNMQIVPYGEIGMSPAISALHYGQAFFEGLKAYKHASGQVSIFRPDKNAERFNKSAERLCMPALPEETFLQSIAALVDLERNWIPEKENYALYIRPVMFATDPFLGVNPSATYKYVVLTGPVGPYFSKNLKVKIELDYSRSTEGGFGYAKAAGNYGGAMLPAQKATEQGFDQLIWTDGKNHEFIEEMGAANIIFILDGKMITPSTRDTILKGVTRDSVLTLAKNWGMEVEERKVSVAEIIEGARNGKLTDGFGVGTAATITQIAQIGYKNEIFNLPDPEKSEFARKLKTTLDDIKCGRVNDEFNWNYLV